MKVKSEESIEEFVAKLPKGNLFSRRSIGRLSLLPHKVRVTEAETYNRTVVEDVQSRNPKMNLKRKIERDLKNNISVDGGNSTVKNSVQKSVLLKEFHELRKSRLSSGLSNSRLNVATPSQNNPVILSSRKRTPFNSGLRNLRSHGKSPAINLANNVNSPYVLSKRFNLRSCKKVSVHSSTKKGISNERNETSRTKVKEKVQENVDQNCCRALQFSEDENEEFEKENTKPLPSLEFFSTKKSGSMLNRRSTILIRSQFQTKRNSVSEKGNRERVSDSNDDYNLTSGLDIRQKATSRGTFRRRYSSINSIKNSQPVIQSKQRRRSEIPSSFIGQLKSENVLSPITERNNSDDSNFSSGFTRRSSRRSHIPLPLNETTNKLPNIFIHPPVEFLNQNTITDEKIQDERVLSESFTIEKNDNNNTCAKCSSKTNVKDSSTNTSDTNEVLQSDFKEIEDKMQKIFSDQLKLENQFELITKDFFREGKKIMQEYKNNFDSLNTIVKEFKHVLTLPRDSLQVEKEKVEQDKCEPVTYAASRNTTKKYKFLGTPIAKKNRKLMHSFSDPPTPTENSSSIQEASFHSVDSVISPFTNIVGDLERPSLLPMTPGSRHVFTNLKSCLNEQLDMLLK